MDDFDLEKLAVKEIIEEIERNKRKQLQAPLTLEQRQPRPNKRFLGRTIVSVLQHNKRQHAEEQRNSSRKLRELNRKRQRSSERHRSRDRYRTRKKSPDQYREIDSRYRGEYEDSEQGAFFYPPPLNLAMCFLNGVDSLMNNIQPPPKKQKKAKRKDVLTIDLTKKTKHLKSKKAKKKALRKKLKSKTHRGRCESVSSSKSSSTHNSSSSGSSVKASYNELIRNRPSPPTLFIDLT